MTTSSKKTIGDFTSKLDVSSTMPLKLPEEVLEVEDYKLISETMDIVAKYRSPSWIEDISLTEMSADLMVLQSNQVTVMYRSSILTSTVDTIEDRLKIERSKVRVKVKEIKSGFERDGNSVAITAEDTKDLSYAKTEGLWTKYSEAKAASDFMKSMYFSLKDLVYMLNNTIQRISRIEHM